MIFPDYIPFPMAWYLIGALVLIAVVRLIQGRIARRKMHRIAGEMRARIKSRGSFVIPGRRPGKHRKWRIEKPRGHGYYHAP